jgi:hypothetical protein
LKDGTSANGVTEYVVEELQLSGDSDPLFGTFALSVGAGQFSLLSMVARPSGNLAVQTSNQSSTQPVAETVLGTPVLPFRVRWETKALAGDLIGWRATITDRNTTLDQSGSAPLLATTITKQVGLNRKIPGRSSFTISGLQLQ